MKTKTKNKLTGVIVAAVFSMTLVATVSASTSYSYNTTVNIDSQRSVIGSSRTYKEKNIGVDVDYPSIGGAATTSDNYTIAVGTTGILTGFIATESTNRTLSERCSNVIYFPNESSSASTRSRAVKFSAGYSSLRSDVRLYDY